MANIRINKIETKLAVDRLREEYQVFNVKTSEKYFGKGANAAKFIDDLSEERFILGVVYEFGNSFHVLLRRSDNNRTNLSKAIGSIPDNDKISFCELAIDEVPTHILLQLLLNSLGTYEGKLMGFHNVTGHFYIHRPSWTKRKELQKIALELRITKDMLLDWSVRTFTSVSLQKMIKFGRKKFCDYPEYVLSKGNTLKRIEKGSDPSAYILRQVGDKKSSIKFLDIQSLDKFLDTKMGAIYDCVENFNATFQGMAHIAFSSFEEYSRIEIEARMLREMQSRYDEMVGSRNIVIVDKVADDTSHIAIDELKAAVLKNFNCSKVSVLKKPKPGCINIILIHEDEHYKDRMDPHDEKYKDCAVQHITIESVTALRGDDDGWKATLNTVMQEALIKDDIENGKISLIDWTNCGYQEDFLFGLAKTDENDLVHYYFMTIHPDGSCEFAEQENSLFDQNEYQTCIDLFSKNDVIGVVKHGEDINVIHNTQLRTLPEIDAIYERLKSGDNKMRDKVSREELFSSVTDVKCFASDDYSLSYFSGIVGAGMRATIATSANIRMVDSYRYSELFFPSLLRLMAVTFVRNGQLTVMPFPFKYLREYIESLD